MLTEIGALKGNYGNCSFIAIALSESSFRTQEEPSDYSVQKAGGEGQLSVSDMWARKQ